MFRYIFLFFLISVNCQASEVNWYTAMSIDNATILVNDFQSRTSIKVNITRLGEESIITRIRTEIVAKQIKFDVVSTKPTVFDDNFGPPKLVFINALVPIYNPRLVKDIPESYQDLLKLEFRDNILMDSAQYDWFAFLKNYLGLSYFRSLATQHPRLYRSFGQITNLVVSGEASIGFANSFRVELLKKKQAPIESVKVYPIPGAPHLAAIAKQAPNPVGSQIFSDYLVSKPAQILISQMNRIAADPQISDHSNIVLIPSSIYKDLAKHQAEFSRIFR